jgi:4-hydroxy-tetrahydrodipicolinate synthase
MTGLYGIGAAAVTPRGKHGEADFGAALELVDFLSKGGVQYISLLGVNGEFSALSMEERTRLTYLATKRSRVPLLVGVGSATLDCAVELGREAAGAGVAGLLAMPPCFSRYDQDDIREYYMQFAAQVGHGVPLYMEHIPWFTSPLEVETATALLNAGLYAGVVDASGGGDSLDRFRELRRRYSFALLSGDDASFVRARRAGADGAISAVACAVPELMMALDRAVRANDAAAAERREARVSEFLAWCARFAAPVVVRAAVAERGLTTGPPAVPMGPEKLRLLDAFREWFRGWLPAVLKDTA